MKNYAFARWLDLLMYEKGIDLEERFELADNNFSYEVIVEQMKACNAEEQTRLKNMLVRLDFLNQDIRAYMRHLAQALVVTL
jgi:hypothetical protein